MHPADLDTSREPADEADASRGRRLVRVVTRTTNLLLAAYLGYSAYTSVAAGSDVWLPIRLVDGAATGLLAVLVLFRGAPLAARWDALAIAAVVVSNGHGFAFDGAPRSTFAFEVAGRATMAAAGLWGSWSRLVLGKSFAILPALRELRTGGPYAIVRHPIYLSLVAYDLATIAVHPSAWNAGVAAAGIAAHVARSAIEDRFLGRDAAYAAYRAKTRHRLIPFVW